MVNKDILVALLEDSPLWTRKPTDLFFDNDYPVFVVVNASTQQTENNSMEIEVNRDSILVTFNDRGTQSRISVELCLWDLELEINGKEKSIVDEHGFNCRIEL